MVRISCYLLILVVVCVVGRIHAMSGTKGTPLGGMGTGYIKFDALTGDFAASNLVPPFGSIPPPADSSDTNWLRNEFVTNKSISSGIHLFSSGLSTKKATAEPDWEAATCPQYGGFLGVVNGVAFTLEAFGPYIPGDGDLNYQLATSPLAFIEIRAENVSQAAQYLPNGDKKVGEREVAVALEFANKSASKSTLLGGTGDAVIDPQSGNKAILFTPMPIAPEGNTGNACLMVDCDDPAADFSAGSIGDFLTTGKLSNENGNLVAATCRVPLNGTVRIRFVFSWWRTFVSDKDRYGSGKNDEENYYYHNFYTNAKEAALFGMQHFNAVQNGVHSIVRRITASNFPAWYTNRLLNNTYPMIQNSQCAKDGRVAFWEGLYPIIGSINQAQYAALWYTHNWPKNQWAELSYWLSTMWQGEYNGQIHNDFNSSPATWTPDAHFLAPRNNWDRKDYWFQVDTRDFSDQNAMVIFKAYELMLATGNKDSMLVYFPKVFMVAERLRVMCKDSNAHLPLKTLGKYLSASWYAPQYVSSIFLPALLAVEAMAKFVEDEATARTYRELYTLAREEFRTEIFEKNEFCQGRSFAEGDIAGYSWARYFCMEPVMDNDVVTEGCRRLWGLYGSQPTLSGKLGQWHFFTCDHWGGSEIAIGNPDRAMQLHKWDRDWNYEGSPSYVFWQDQWSFANNYYASNVAAPSVWRSYWQFLGYLLDNANKRLWIRPQIPTSMNGVIENAPLINPRGWGTLQYSEKTTVMENGLSLTQDIRVTYDSSVTIKELVLNNNTGMEGPLVDVRNGTQVVEGITLVPETRGTEKNIRLTFAPPLIIGPSGLSVKVYTNGAGTINGMSHVRKMPLSIHSSSVSGGRDIAYSVDNEGEVTMEMLHLNGTKAGTIMKRGNHAAGRHSFRWNGKTVEGKRLSAVNMYILRLTSSAGTVSRLVFNSLIP